MSRGLGDVYKRQVQKVEQVIEERKLGRVEELILGNTPFGISSDLYAHGRQVPLFMSKIYCAG